MHMMLVVEIDDYCICDMGLWVFVCVFIEPLCRMWYIHVFAAFDNYNYGLWCVKSELMVLVVSSRVWDVVAPFIGVSRIRLAIWYHHDSWHVWKCFEGLLMCLKDVQIVWYFWCCELGMRGIPESGKMRRRRSSGQNRPKTWWSRGHAAAPHMVSRSAITEFFNPDMVPENSGPRHHFRKFEDNFGTIQIHPWSN